MNRTQARRFLLKVTSVLCAVLFVGVGVSILDTRPSAAGTLPELAYDVVRRVPASLLKEKPKPRPAQIFKVWQPPCLKPNVQLAGFKTDSSWIRISTHSCDDDQEISQSLLENKSNGYVATLFTTSSRQITSDFIPLADGDNEFHLDVKMQSGEHLDYQWTIERTPATASN